MPMPASHSPCLPTYLALWRVAYWTIVFHNYAVLLSCWFEILAVCPTNLPTTNDATLNGSSRHES